jgi:hypothetical protein
MLNRNYKVMASGLMPRPFSYVPPDAGAMVHAGYRHAIN